MHTLNKVKKTARKVPKRCLSFDEESNTYEDADDPVNFCEETDKYCDLETLSDIEGQSYGLDEFVIVYYEGEYFPGQIKDVRENDDKTGNEWRWPDQVDKIWYVEGQIVERISPPSTTNSRGVCTIQAISKYRFKQ